MSCKTPKVLDPTIPMIIELCDKIGVAEFIRRNKELWYASGRHLTAKETVWMLHEGIVRGSISKVKT